MSAAALVSYFCYAGLLICLLVGVAATALISNVLWRISEAPAGLPWVGLKDRRIFPKLRACFGELAAARALVEEGYNKVQHVGEVGDCH